MILLHHKFGQLANRMILIIHFTAYCLDRKVSLRISNFEEYMSQFDSTALKSLENYSIIFCKRKLFHRIQLSFFYKLKNVSKISRLIDVRQSHDAVEQTFDLRQFDDYINLYSFLIPEGWLFRCTALTEKYRNEIIHLFQPNDESKENINALIEQVPDQYLKVGVHIRRRDYREFKDGKYFYNDDTYLSLMDQFEVLFKDKEIQFLVFSDEDISNVIRNRKHVLVSGNNFMEDFFFMSNCDYLMGPPSTFTLVAAYLGGCKLNHIENPLQPLSLHNFQTISCL